MRTYLLVILIIVSMMAGYIALLPLAAWPDADMGLSAAGPG
jgi:hypothetical protein